MQDETPLLDLYAQEVEALKDTPPVSIYAEKLAVLAMISNIQLALRHPGSNGWIAEQGRAIAEQLQQIFPVDSAIYKVIKMGFNPIFDSPQIQVQCSESPGTESAAEIYQFVKNKLSADLDEIGWEIIEDDELWSDNHG